MNLKREDKNPRENISTHSDLVGWQSEHEPGKYSPWRNIGLICYQ